jgi:hypothetical protein
MIRLDGSKTANLSRLENRRSTNRYATVVHGAQRAERKWQSAKSPQPDHDGVSLTGAVECTGRLDVDVKERQEMEMKFWFSETQIILSQKWLALSGDQCFGGP